MDEKDYEKLPDIVGVMEEFHGRLHLDADREQALLGHVRAVKGQLYQPRADERAVTEHLAAIREILRPLDDNELATAAASEIDGIIGPGKSRAGETGAAGKETEMSEATDRGRKLSAAVVVAAVVGTIAGAALGVAGGWMVDDGLLGGYVADRKEMGIGVAVLAAGVFLLMVGARAFLRHRVLRVALGIVVLAGVVVFALAEAGRARETGGGTINIENPVHVKIEGGRHVPVPPEAVRPARWYEGGIRVTVEKGFEQQEMVVPQKYVVVPDPQ